MSTSIHSHWEFITDPGNSLFSYSDKIMSALLTQEDCVVGFTDSAVATDARLGVIEVEANAVGDDLSHAIAIAQSCVRAAVHKVGIQTPDWPAHGEVMSMVLKGFSTEQFV